MTQKDDGLVIISEKKEKACAICGTNFIPRIPSINIIEDNGKLIYVCSFQHRTEYLSKNIKTEQCSYCGKEFKPKYAFQTLQLKQGGQKYYLCSVECQRSFIDELKKDAMKKNGIDKMTDTTRKIAVFTQKGGTGKTTTALNLSVALSVMGYKVLLIDGDPQGNISISLGLKHNSKSTLYNIFQDNPNFEDIIYIHNKNLHIITSDQQLAAINISLAQQQSPRKRHTILKQKIEPIEKRYDFIVMDCSPALSVLNHNLLYVAEEVLIPVSCDYLSLAGLKQVMSTLDDVRKFFTHHIEVIGIVPTFFIQQQIASRKVVSELRHRFKDLVLAPIRESASIRLSAFEKTAIVVSQKQKRTAGYDDYHALAETITKRKPQKHR